MTFSSPLGAHVDGVDPIAAARDRAAEIVQIFCSDPKSWSGVALAELDEGLYPNGAVSLRSAAEQSGVGIYVHAPYLINVASTNNRIRVPSRRLLQKTLHWAAELGARGVIVHGGHVSADADPDEGRAHWFKAIDTLELPVPLLIENTAGGKHAMARHLDALAQLWEAIASAAGFEQVGFCLDTCHAHAAGWELSRAVADVFAITGRIDLVHANDSRDAVGSGADRHANLGAGNIAPDELVGVVAAAGAPVIVETPGDAATQGADLAWLRARL